METRPTRAKLPGGKSITGSLLEAPRPEAVAETLVAAAGVVTHLAAKLLWYDFRTDSRLWCLNQSIERGAC